MNERKILGVLIISKKKRKWKLNSMMVWWTMFTKIINFEDENLFNLSFQWIRKLFKCYSRKRRTWVLQQQWLRNTGSALNNLGNNYNDMRQYSIALKKFSILRRLDIANWITTKYWCLFIRIIDNDQFGYNLLLTK